MDQKVKPSNILLPLIEDSYKAEYTEWQRRNLRFSDAGTACKEGEKCERQIYYDIYMSDQKTGLYPGSLVFFDDGRLHEADIRRRLRLVLRSPEKEVFEEESGAKGKLDNTIYFGTIKESLKDYFEPGTAILKEDPGLEIKTANHFQYMEMAENGYILQTYYDQIQLYLWKTKKPFFLCLIKNRNSMGAGKGELPFLEFMVLPDEKRQKELLAGLRTVAEAITKRILPPRPFLRESTQCTFCRFKHVCWPPLPEEKKEDLVLEGKAPQKEILESAIRTYHSLGRTINKAKKEQEEARAVIEAFFKATGVPDIMVDEIKASYPPKSSKIWDLEYLKKNLSLQQQLGISTPDIKKLEAAIEAREIDAIVADQAIKIQKAGNSIRVSEVKIKESARVDVLKKGVKNDKGVKRSKKVSKARKNKARGKSTGKRKNGSNPAERSGVLHSGSEHRESDKG